MANKKKDGTLSSLKQTVLKFLDPDWEDRNSFENEEYDFETEAPSEFHLNEVVSKKVRMIIDDFIAAAPLIEAAGFRIRDLEVELSIIPKLIPHFEKLTNTDETTRLQIIEQVKDKRIIRMLLKTLFKADNFQQSLKMGKLEFAGIEIEITAIPAVRLVYKNPARRTDLVL